MFAEVLLCDLCVRLSELCVEAKLKSRKDWVNAEDAEQDAEFARIMQLSGCISLEVQ